jgi:lysophospholipase L1-like esterase
MRTLSLCLAVVASFFVAGTASAAEFPLKDGDVWVMAGDSITAQHLHSNYFEAFCFARYPKLKFAFRNSGVGGHTIPSTLARFDYDVAAWKPTIISVELGMNDSGGTPTDKFVENMGTMVERIRKAGARPIILSASPVNDGTRQASLNGRNIRLDEYATALKVFSEKEKIPYSDQFHALLDVWGKNKPQEVLAGNLAMVRSMAGNNGLEGVEHLRAFLELHDKKPVKPVSMQGDPVHPGPCGQLMMAAALLKRLGAEPFVSSVTINPSASGQSAVEAKGCVVSDVKNSDGVLAFDRTDECLPFPIADAARSVLPLAPEVFELSQYLLTVKGLAPGTYVLKINGKPCSVVTEKQLADGLNLTDLAAVPANAENPINAQAQAVLKAVEAKEGLVNQFRGLSQRALAAGPDSDGMKQLAEMGRKVEAEDEKIRAAAKPQKLHFEIAPQK